MRRFLATVIVGIVLGAPSAIACPSCAESVGTPVEPAANRASGYNAAIWIMLGGAGVGLAAVGGVLALSMRPANPPQS